MKIKTILLLILGISTVSICFAQVGASGSGSTGGGSSTTDSGSSQGSSSEIGSSDGNRPNMAGSNAGYNHQDSNFSNSRNRTTNGVNGITGNIRPNGVNGVGENNNPNGINGITGMNENNQTTNSTY